MEPTDNTIEVITVHAHPDMVSAGVTMRVQTCYLVLVTDTNDLLVNEITRAMYDDLRALNMPHCELRDYVWTR